MWQFHLLITHYNRQSFVISCFRHEVIILLIAETARVETANSWEEHMMKCGICLLSPCPFIICVQIHTSMPPGTPAEASDQWGDLAESYRSEKKWASGFHHSRSLQTNSWQQKQRLDHTLETLWMTEHLLIVQCSHWFCSFVGVLLRI